LYKWKLSDSPRTQKEEQEMHKEMDSDTMTADFEITTSAKVPPAAVFEALTTTAGLSGWWTKASGSGAAGGELTFVFNGSRMIMRVDEAASPSTVRWTVLMCEPEADWVGTEIAFDVRPDEDGGARVHFQHLGLTPRLECFDDCNAGWTRFMASLVSFVESGHGDPFAQTVSDAATKSGDYEAARSLKASPEAVFEALTTMSGLAGWWTHQVSGSGVQGGELTFRFEEHGVQKVMRVDEAVAPSTVRWTVLSCTHTEWVGTAIMFHVSPGEGGGSRLHFRHLGLTPELDCFEACSPAWTHFMGSLVDYVESGHGEPYVPPAA
jgi:uncharacterized protein YndB with AHSA1/START domain